MSLRTVVLLRHGEAEHISPVGDDHGRRLTGRGRRQIDTTSRQLLEMKFQASLVYCSNAKRTLETYETLSSDIFPGALTKYEAALYHASENVIFDYLFQTDDAVPSILIVGHNPGLSDMVSQSLAPRHLHLGTGEAILFQAELDSWSQCDLPGTWKMIQHVRPGKTDKLL